MARENSFLSSTFIVYSIIATLVALAFIPTQVQPLTLDSDVQVLRLLKQSIDPISIQPYSYISTWDFSMDPCETAGGFLGILCTFPMDNSSNRIMAIDLDAAGYDGFLTPSISNLSELTILGLSRNQFRGPIPGTISNFRKLVRLSLSDNLFTGTIPNGITQLKKLEVVDISRNRLSGSIPPNISTLRSLKVLRASNNQFYGKIPDLSGNWQLNTLDLSMNQLFGNLPKLPINLRTMNLRHNILSGHITPVTALHRLTTLDVSDNRLSGRISNEILTLPMIFRINMSINHFTLLDPIKVPVRNTQLQVLDAHYNQLRGRLPTSLVALETLTTIDLSHNLFFGPIPTEYGAKLGKSWKNIYLDNNFLVGTLPSQFINGTSIAIKGSLANNCLKCPSNITFCRGGQRKDSECVTRSSGSE